MFCRSLFVLLPFLFWPLYCLFFFNLRILITSLWFLQALLQTVMVTGADPGFQVRGANLKKLRRAEGSAKIFGVFRVKNHDFTQKNHIFSNFRGGRAPGAPPPPPPPWIRPCIHQMMSDDILKDSVMQKPKKYTFKMSLRSDGS
jgi:hypothetical protein